MAMDGESVESVELAIGQWTRNDRGRPSIVSSSFRPPAGARRPPDPPSKQNRISEFYTHRAYGFVTTNSALLGVSSKSRRCYRHEMWKSPCFQGFFDLTLRD